MSYKQKKAIKKHVRDTVISRDIVNYGAPALHSEAFQRAFSETHHLRGSVSDHSLTVCIAAVRICLFLQKAGFCINEKDLIQASLCHDLGMIGRSDKYRRRTEAWHSHPADKFASSADWVFFLTGKQYCGTIRKKLRTE